jgi:hypothetical protein
MWVQALRRAYDFTDTLFNITKLRKEEAYNNTIRHSSNVQGPTESLVAGFNRYA